MPLRRMVVSLVVLLFVAAACGGGAAPSASGSAAAPATVIVGYSEIYEGALPMWYAFDKGIFKKNGIDADLRYTQSSTGVAALLAGEIQVFQGGGSETLSAVAGGADLVVLGNLVPVYPYVFMVPGDIKNADELKGKKVGVSSPGSTSDIATRVALPKVGITPDRDVTIVPVGSSQNRTAAMLNGSIQGGLDQPPGSIALEAKGFHVLFDLAALKLPVVNNGIVVQRKWLDANRSVAQRYIDSLVQAIAAIKKDRAGALDVLKKNLKVDDQKQLDGTYDYSTKLFPALPAPALDQFKDSVDVLSKNNPKIKDVDIAKMIDASFVKNAGDRGLDR